jgi:hypothetical protein
VERPPGFREPKPIGSDVWAENGLECIRKFASKNPDGFVTVAAKLIPQDVKLAAEQTYAGLSPDDYAVLRAIREAIPEANNQSPQAVLEYVRDTLRAADWRRGGAYLN